MPPDKLPTSFRLSDEAKALLEMLAEEASVSQVSILETLIRQRARTRGITPPQEPASND